MSLDTAVNTAVDQRVALRPSVAISGPRYRGPRTVHLVRDAATDRCFEVGPREAFLASRLREPVDRATVSTAYAGAFGRELSPVAWGRFLGLLHARGLLDDGRDSSHTDSARPAPTVRDSDLRTGRWVVAPVSGLVERLHAALRPAFTSVSVGLTAVLVAAMLGWLVVTAAADPQALQPLHDWRFLVVVGLLSWVSLSLHELGHGLAAQHCGGRATEVGVLFRPPMVYLYCRVEGGAYVTSRRSQVAVALAGVWVNLVLLLPLWVWALLDSDPARRRVLVAGMVVGALVGLVNLVPLRPADGYAALAAALGQLDLAGDSARCVADTTHSLLHRDATPVAYPPARCAVYLGYAAVRALLLLAIAAAVVWYCLRVLPPAAGAPTLAAALAFVLTVSVVRLAGTRTPVPTKGIS